MSNPEFDRFGIFRSHQVTYTRGGEDRSIQHKFCAQDSDCDTNACKDGKCESVELY